MDHGVFSATSSVRGRFNPVVTIDSQLGNILLSGSGEATGGLNSPHCPLMPIMEFAQNRREKIGVTPYIATSLHWS